MPQETPARMTEWKALEHALTQLAEICAMVKQKARALEERLIQPQPDKKVLPPMPPTIYDDPIISNGPPLLRFVEHHVRINVDILYDAEDILSSIAQELT